jgi:hypothetical protein
MTVKVIKANQNLASTTIVEDTSADSTLRSNTTGDSGTLYSVEIDNSLNSDFVYFKFADSADATGSVALLTASMVLPATGSSVVTYNIPTGSVFVNGFSHWCVGGPEYSSTTNPTFNVAVRYTVIDD